jgi:hypothetical protein
LHSHPVLREDEEQRLSLVVVDLLEPDDAEV